MSSEEFSFFLEHCNPAKALKYFTKQVVANGIVKECQSLDSSQGTNRMALFITTVMKLDSTVRTCVENFDSAVPSKVLCEIMKENANAKKLIDGESIRDMDSYLRYGMVDYILIPPHKYRDYFQLAEGVKKNIPKYWKRYAKFLRDGAIRILPELDGDEKTQFIKLIVDNEIVAVDGGETMVMLQLLPRDLVLLHLGLPVGNTTYTDEMFNFIISSVSQDPDSFISSIQDLCKKSLVGESTSIGNEESISGSPIFSYPREELFAYHSGKTVYIFTREEFDTILEKKVHPYTRQKFSKGTLELIRARKKFIELTTPAECMTILDFLKKLDSSFTTFTQTRERAGDMGGMQGMMQDMMSKMMPGGMPSGMDASMMAMMESQPDGMQQCCLM